MATNGNLTAAVEYVLEFELPSGKKVQMRKGKGRDLRLALMAAGPRADQYRIMLALIMQLSLVDGKKVPFELTDEWDMEDVLELTTQARQILRPLGPAIQAAQQVDQPELFKQAAEDLPMAEPRL